LRSDRKTQIISVLALLAGGYMMFTDNTPVRRAAKPKPQVSVGANDPNERWKDLVERFNGQLNTLTNTTNALQEEVSNQKKAMQEYEATTAEIFKKILERLAEVQTTSNAPSVQSSGPQDLGEVSAPDIIAASPDELEPIGGAESVPAQPPVQPAKPRLAAIMPGDSVRVKMLAGVNAPTDGTPYPVVLKLIGNVLGPDGNSIPLGEARIIAAAQGSLTDSRALLRLTRLSLRLPNGRRKEFPIDGWVVGEDGIRGMEGVLIDPIGKAIAGAAMAGGLGGLGEGMRAANTDTLTYSNGSQSRTVDSSQIPAFAGGVALSSAATEWQQIIRDRIRILVPVVQVLSGREATAVFSQSLAIPDLLEAVDEDPSVVYTSLD
ncbi:MAG: TrbI/VirB10 family protein, partial [Pseudomonadota bacterium]